MRRQKTKMFESRLAELRKRRIARAALEDEVALKKRLTVALESSSGSEAFVAEISEACFCAGRLARAELLLARSSQAVKLQRGTSLSDVGSPKGGPRRRSFVACAATRFSCFWQTCWSMRVPARFEALVEQLLGRSFRACLWASGKTFKITL